MFLGLTALEYMAVEDLFLERTGWLTSAHI